MGSYVSVVRCQSDYGVYIKCNDTNFNPENGTLRAGNYSRGSVPPNPDVAGVGIVSVFIAVTMFALALSAINVLWRTWKLHQNLPPASPEKLFSLTEICEALVLSCSDQQVFTGGAFAILLRYSNGCSVTAYHYNVIANMLLLTCATHLMSMSVVRNYWRNLWQSSLRVILIFGIVLVTGLVLTNQDADTDVKFPTSMTDLNGPNDGRLFLPAACYQADAHMMKTVQETVGTAEQFRKGVFNDSPNNHIQGWGYYLAMLLWYLLALFVTYVRRFYHIFRRYGVWAAIGRAFVPICCSSWVPEEEGDTNSRRHKFFQWLHTIYMLCGVSLGSATAITSAKFIIDMRSWVNNSGWLASDLSNLQVGPEDDATSFGQQVPILLTLLTVFTAAQTVNELWDKRRGAQLLHAAKPSNTMTSPNGSQDQPPGKPGTVTGASNGVGLVHQYLWTTESHPMLSPQPVVDQSPMGRPTRTSSTMTANAVPPTDAYGTQYQPVGSLGPGDCATEIHGPISPISNGGGLQSPLRHISSAASSMRSPSNQASVQSPQAGLWTEAPSETAYFLPRSPPRSDSNVSRNTAP